MHWIPSLFFPYNEHGTGRIFFPVIKLPKKSFTIFFAPPKCGSLFRLGPCLSSHLSFDCWRLVLSLLGSLMKRNLLPITQVRKWISYALRCAMNTVIDISKLSSFIGHQNSLSHSMITQFCIHVQTSVSIYPYLSGVKVKVDFILIPGEAREELLASLRRT